MSSFPQETFLELFLAFFGTFFRLLSAFYGIYGYYRADGSAGMRVGMEEGMTVFYVENGTVYSGKAVDVEWKNGSFLFSIDNYGGCEGLHRISSSQIGRTVFFSEEDAENVL